MPADPRLGFVPEEAEDFFVEVFGESGLGLPRRDMPFRGLREDVREKLRAMHPTEEQIARVEAQIAESQAQRKANSRQERSKKLDVTTDALKMRERRKDPEIKRREVLALRSRNRALETLANNHPAEFLALVQEYRRECGLQPLQPRAKRMKAVLGVQETPLVETRPTPAKVGRPRKVPQAQPPRAVLTPPPQTVRDHCRHNMGLTKLSYGTFCIECGHKVR